MTEPDVLVASKDADAPIKDSLEKHLVPMVTLLIKEWFHLVLTHECHLAEQIDVPTILPDHAIAWFLAKRSDFDQGRSD